MRTGSKFGEFFRSLHETVEKEEMAIVDAEER